MALRLMPTSCPSPTGAGPLDPEAFRLSFFLAGLGLMLLVETLRPARPWRVSRLRRFAFHAGLAAANLTLLRILTAAPLLAWAAHVRDRELGLLPWLGLTGVTEVLVALVILDLFDYWWHRWNHRVRFLWRFHKVHHGDTHLDATTSLRFHAGELFNSAVMKAGWILILGPSVWAFAVFEGAITLASQFHHANVDLPSALDRRLRRVLVTPRFHTSHHAVAPETGDNNFTTILVLWDHLFGTWRAPEITDPGHLGLAEGRETDLAPLNTLLAPLDDTNPAGGRRAFGPAMT